MPFVYARRLRTMPPMPPEMEALSGGNRKKLRQHRREAHALMGLRMKEYEESKAKLEALLPIHEALVRDFSGLANRLEARGVSFEQMIALTGASPSEVTKRLKEKVTVTQVA